MSYNTKNTKLPKKKLPITPRKTRMRFHVCIPLYRGIPKEQQAGWTRMGAHGVAEWDNTADLLPWLAMYPKLDKQLYCGTCGRCMVKGRNRTSRPLEESKKIKLV